MVYAARLAAVAGVRTDVALYYSLLPVLLVLLGLHATRSPSCSTELGHGVMRWMLKGKGPYCSSERVGIPTRV